MGTLIHPPAQGAALTPLAEELTSATVDPWEMCQQLAGLPHVLFFDSARGSPHGRFSFLCGDPFEWLWARGRQVFAASQTGSLEESDPFRVLADYLGRFRQAALPGLPPFQGGAAGLFSYELGHHIERLPRAEFDDFAVPDLAVGLYDWVLAFDHQRQRCWLISTGWPETNRRRQLSRASQRLQQVKDWLRQGVKAADWSPDPPCPIRMPQAAVPGLAGLTSNFSPEEYLATVRRAIDYVHAGDCFQVNISQRLLTATGKAPLELYRRLRNRNPSPFGGYFDLGEFVLASASPERFLQLRQGEVVTCPIKGTRPRGSTAGEDQRQAAELLASPKDRAENIMIVDLLRNDLGRVCSYGSIRVEALCRLESYQFVHHLVSEIHGRLRPDLGAIDLLRAAFPGGSVTGAPKIRAMEIIAELERTARGPYCGCLGYLGFEGSMDTNLLIRTFVVGKGWTQFAVGGGIVADSDPQREYEETLHKAEGLLRALNP